MEKKLTATNTKTEILEAYNELLQKMQTESRKNPKEEKALEQKIETVKAAAALSAEGIVKSIANIKLEIASSLDKVEESLVQEFRKLEKLQQAIQYESAYLEDLYGIKANADSLAVLLMANKEKKQVFEKEIEEKKAVFDEVMQEKKQAWEKEQKERLQQWKEDDDAQKKNRKREEDDYRYNLSIARKKDEDDYNARKNAMEKELADKKQSVEKELTEREKIIAAKEAEFMELKKQVEAFPLTLDKAVADGRKQLEEQLTTRYKFEKEIFSKEMESEIKLLKQTISSLQTKIGEQELLINTLNEKTNTAGNQVQTIALKALEGAASLRYSFNERREDKEKNAGA